MSDWDSEVIIGRKSVVVVQEPTLPSLNLKSTLPEDLVWLLVLKRSTTLVTRRVMLKDKD